MAIHPGPAAPDGPYPVGATRFVRSVREHLVVGQSRLCPCKRGTRGERTCSHAQDEFDTLDPTLIMDEIEFLAFYPADVPTDGGWRSWLHWGRHKVRRGMRWFVRPVSEAANGYEAMMGQAFPKSNIWTSLLKKTAALYGARIQIPVYENAPLLRAPNGEAWPLVLFSHGLTGTATTYSALCMHLASRGRVVLALEHRDGSGAATFPRMYNGMRRTLRYVSPAEVIWPDGATSPDANRWTAGGYNSEVALRLRADQLEFRRRELYEALHAVSLLNKGEVLQSALEVPSGRAVDLRSWAGAVDDSHVDLVGHSFGGATLFSILSKPPPRTLNDPRRHHARIAVRQTLALDPWIEPVPSPGPVPHSDPDNTESTASKPESSPQLLVMNSESLTFFDTHFSSLQAAAAAFKPSRVVTVVRAEHVSFSDLPALVPRGILPADERRVLRVICVLADAFLNRQVPLEGGPEAMHVPGINFRPMEVEWVGRGKDSKKQLVGEEGDVAVHSF